MKTIIVALLLVLFYCSTTISATPTTVSISPASDILIVNDTLNITLTIFPGQEIDTIAADLLSWNPNVLQCISLIRGNLFSNPLIWLCGKINNTAGTIKDSVVGSDVPTTISGTYCIITFKAKASGISTIAINEFGVARSGSIVPFSVLNNCQITVEDLYTPPINPPTNQTNTTNTTNTNTTINPSDNDSVPIDNESINTTTPPEDWFAPNETYIPIQNETENENITGKEKISPGLFDNIPPTTIIYAIIAIILISVFAYIIARHFQHRQEDKEDEMVEQDENGETDIDDFITDNFGA